MANDFEKFVPDSLRGINETVVGRYGSDSFRQGLEKTSNNSGSTDDRKNEKEEERKQQEAAKKQKELEEQLRDIEKEKRERMNPRKPGGPTMFAGSILGFFGIELPGYSEWKQAKEGNYHPNMDDLEDRERHIQEYLQELRPKDKDEKQQKIPSQDKEGAELSGSEYRTMISSLQEQINSMQQQITNMSRMMGQGTVSVRGDYIIKGNPESPDIDMSPENDEKIELEAKQFEPIQIGSKGNSITFLSEASAQKMADFLKALFGEENITPQISQNAQNIMDNSRGVTQSINDMKGNSKIKLGTMPIGVMMAGRRLAAALETGDRSILEELEQENADEKMVDRFASGMEAKTLGEREIPTDKLKNIANSPQTMDRLLQHNAKSSHNATEEYSTDRLNRPDAVERASSENVETSTKQVQNTQLDPSKLNIYDDSIVDSVGDVLKGVFGEENVTPQMIQNAQYIMSHKESVKQMINDVPDDSKFRVGASSIGVFMAARHLATAIETGDTGILSELSHADADEKMIDMFASGVDAKYLGERAIQAGKLKQFANSRQAMDKVLQSNANNVRRAAEGYNAKNNVANQSRMPGSTLATDMPDGAVPVGKYNMIIPGKNGVVQRPGVNEKQSADERAQLTMKSLNGKGSNGQKKDLDIGKMSARERYQSSLQNIKDSNQVTSQKTIKQPVQPKATDNPMMK